MIAAFWRTIGDSVAVPVVVSFATVAVTLWLQRVADSRASRRDRYSQVIGTLVAWVEYPYRVRRRTSDDPAVLTALADRGHDFQEQLARDQSWVMAESKAVAKAYATAKSTISPAVGAALKEAWQHEPVSAAAGMNLNGWGPHGDCSEAIADMEQAVARRMHRRN